MLCLCTDLCDTVKRLEREFLSTPFGKHDETAFIYFRGRSKFIFILLTKDLSVNEYVVVRKLSKLGRLV